MMPTKRGFCAIILLVLISLGSSRPYKRDKRSLVKDYINPLTYPTANVRFEKGEDGKYHPHPIDSKDEYASSQSIGAKYTSTEEGVKSFGDLKGSGTNDVENPKEVSLGPKSGETAVTELEKMDGDSPTTDQVDHSVKKELPKSDDPNRFEEDKLDSESKSKQTQKQEKLDGDKGKFSLVKPEDHKMLFVPKPDGKDDQAYEINFSPEEYLPEPPLSSEKKSGDGKLAIGQIPFYRPPFLARGIPMFVPQRSFSFGALSLMPMPGMPPAIDISDRLPVPEVDAIEEGSETAVIGNVDPAGSVVSGERRTVVHPFQNPFEFGLSLPFMPMKKILKEAVDGDKLRGDARSQIVDVMGKKMLLQRKVIKYPTEDASHMYVSVMSAQPLENVDPEILKELEAEKEILGVGKSDREQELKSVESNDSIEKSILKNTVDKAPISKGIDRPKKVDSPAVEAKPFPESDVLKVEESQLDAKTYTTGTIGIHVPGVVPEMQFQSFRNAVPNNQNEKEVTSTVEDEAKTAENDNATIEEATAKADENKVMKDTATVTAKHEELDKRAEAEVKSNSLENKDNVALSVRYPESTTYTHLISDKTPDSFESDNKTIGESKEDDEEDKVTTEGKELAKAEGEKSSTEVENAHELFTTSEMKDDKDKEDSIQQKASKNSLERKDLKLEAIDLSKGDGFFFVDRKKKFEGDGKEKVSIEEKNKKGKKSEPEESGESDSDDDE